MPVYMCRWPNGDFSFVSASNRPEAESALDEVDNSEGCPFLIDDDFMVHFHLADDGGFRLEGFGESTHQIVWKRYPRLEEAFFQLYENDPKFRSRAKTPEQKKVITPAVEEERQRVTQRSVKPPSTLLGQEIKGSMGAPTSMIEGHIKTTSKKILKEFKPKGKPN